LKLRKNSKWAFEKIKNNKETQKLILNFRAAAEGNSDEYDALRHMRLKN
jgi:hypothetical protein